MYSFDTHIRTIGVHQAFLNLYWYALSQTAFNPGLNIDEIIRLILLKEPYNAALRIIPFDTWYLDFETEDDYIIFALRWAQ